jgi:spore coat protein A
MEIICYPNPISDRGVLEFTLDRNGRCEVRLFDVTGRYIRTLADRVVEPGEQRIEINVSDIRDGMYVCQVRLNDAPIAVTRMMKVASGN